MRQPPTEDLRRSLPELVNDQNNEGRHQADHCFGARRTQGPREREKRPGSGTPDPSSPATIAGPNVALAVVVPLGPARAEGKP